MLCDDINNVVKEVMKVKDECKFFMLCMMNLIIKNVDIDVCGQGKLLFFDVDLFGVFQKMIKQWQELVEFYDKGGCVEFVQQECEEIVVILVYLLKQMFEDDVKKVIMDVIVEMGVVGMKDMGKVIVVLCVKYVGQMDFGKVSGLVKVVLMGQLLFWGEMKF